jgi:hypothetical protein
MLGIMEGKYLLEHDQGNTVLHDFNQGGLRLIELLWSMPALWLTVKRSEWINLQ